MTLPLIMIVLMVVDQVLDPKRMQIDITGFLEKKAPEFMEELWTLLCDAQEQPSGIPSVFLEKKKEEILKRQKRTLDSQDNQSEPRSRSTPDRFEPRVREEVESKADTLEVSHQEPRKSPIAESNERHRRSRSRDRDRDHNPRSRERNPNRDRSRERYADAETRSGRERRVDDRDQSRNKSRNYSERRVRSRSRDRTSLSDDRDRRRSSRRSPSSSSSSSESSNSTSSSSRRSRSAERRSRR
jgi:serine/arginine repetitive matrix protein 1